MKRPTKEATKDVQLNIRYVGPRVSDDPVNHSPTFAFDESLIFPNSRFVEDLVECLACLCPMGSMTHQDKRFADINPDGLRLQTTAKGERSPVMRTFHPT